MSNTVYYIISAVLSLLVLLGIRWMSKVPTAVRGNRLSALAMLVAIIIVLLKENILTDVYVLIGLAIGLVVGIVMAQRVKMITMPQMVGLLNGLGGLASAIAAILTVQKSAATLPAFERLTALLALCVGALTFTGSMVAAGKLHRVLPQKPVVLPSHRALTAVFALGMAALTILALVDTANVMTYTWLALAVSLIFGLLFALPVGGADMPITISLLNSTSGVAAAIAGMAIGDVLLVSVGGIVGASGLLLTQIMCRSMNRHLSSIIFARSAADSHHKVEAPAPAAPAADAAPVGEEAPAEEAPAAADENVLPQWLGDAKEVIIIPGYGMAVSQAQELVKALHDKLENGGRNVRFAIHPVAGRMPGHMNVLLAEVDIPYDKLYEMDDINPDMEKCDLAIVIGANDVVNPAANTAEGTPIYGMPVLNAEAAGRLVICNFDLKPGYAGVPNPLYDPHPDVLLLLGDAKDSLQKMLDALA
ncbi:MAG: NAD(P)(+) transhydrogenase (Re/Si-specific) subunit beta [Clostridiales bacterium]|nr:NAD(P)(+) transhydrogenase (Re/Si-specific) subunit beta [Clostridiales bacterium]